MYTQYTRNNDREKEKARDVGGVVQKRPGTERRATASAVDRDAPSFLGAPGVADIVREGFSQTIDGRSLLHFSISLEAQD